ncbi:transcriptional activator of glycolytic enzymes-domain-containing protein [Fusarium oxysporum]|nr:transcriptional activator of glycolytic enzymes-domain-containing protein [Fusarium oxysporum]
MPVVAALAKVFTVLDVWKEWEEGIAGQPAVRVLEETWGSRWRPGNGIRVQFCRRKVIWDELLARTASGKSEEEAVAELELLRAGWSLNRLVDELKQRRRRGQGRLRVQLLEWFAKTKFPGVKNMRCLKHLYVTDPRDDKQRILETKGGLLKGSYCWILKNDRFQRFRDDPQSPLLWIKGDLGKGKTMLLCGIIDELEKESAKRLSYFFCQATEAQLSSATGVRAKYDTQEQKLFESINAWVPLTDIFMDMLNDPALEDVVLIVDALDECKTKHSELLDFIFKSPSHIKWIVSSRNHCPDIGPRLRNATHTAKLCLEDIGSTICEAVDAYIRHKVDQLICEENYDDKLRYAVQHYFMSHANGTFLWVTLVWKEPADPRVPRQHMLTKLTSFPAGLDQLYERMMEHIINSDDAGLCKQILATVSVVYSPVTLKELISLVESLEEFDQDELKEIIGSCGSFLTLRKGVIYFVHQSAKEYLLDKASNQIVPSGTTDQHHTIFSRSLLVMSRSLRRDMYNLNHPGISIDDVRQPDPNPLASARYSCFYWVDHLSAAGRGIPGFSNNNTPKTSCHIRDLGKNKTPSTRRRYSVISKGFEAQESKIASLSTRVASLEEEVGRLSRGKKRKAIPNPNRRFMTLAEALVADNNIYEPNQATAETEAAEDVIEVGGVEEDESTNSEAEELPVARTRAGRAVKRSRGYWMACNSEPRSSN